MTLLREVWISDEKSHEKVCYYIVLFNNIVRLLKLCKHLSISQANYE